MISCIANPLYLKRRRDRGRPTTLFAAPAAERLRRRLESERQAIEELTASELERLGAGSWSEPLVVPGSGVGRRSLSGLRFSTLAGQVGRPVGHEPPPLEQVRAPVGLLDLVPDQMVPIGRRR